MALASPRATPSAPLPPVRASSTGPRPAIAAADGVPLAPLAAPPSSSPLAAAPWQSGQPSPPPSDRVARSWRIIDLPAFDPAQFERQRRIVLRVAIGLVGFVIGLAVLAGRC
jgi:hypothetical protein